MKKASLIIIVTSTLAFSCKKDKDLDPPEIRNLMVDGVSDEIYLPIESTFTIKANITDNEELSQLKLDIHHNFDSHAHKNNLVFFSLINIHDISGKVYAYEEKITIPENVKAGPYHVGLYAVDAAGFQSPETFVDLIVTRPDAPLVNFSYPDFSSNYAMNGSDTLKPEGIIVDNEKLEKIIISLRRTNTSEVVFDTEFDLSGSSMSAWDMQLDGNLMIVPGAVGAGKYTLLMRAEDNDGNVTLHREMFNIN